MSKEKLPTPEEVLYEHGNKHPDSWNGFAYYHDSVLFSMESYKRSHTAPLQARIEDLEKQERHWRQQATKYQKYHLELNKALEENKRLREALEGLIPLAEDGYCHHKLNGCHEDTLEEDRGNLKIAKEALKGETKQ